VSIRACILFTAAGLVYAQQTAPRPSASEELVTIEKITVHGTRFAEHSIEVLTGLSRGSEINEAAVRKAIGRMLESGLIKSVDYNYESLEDPKAVALDLNITDELPLLPATIEIPGVDAEAVWEYMQSVDPLFTRELPRTQKALRFYIRAITDYLRENKRQDVVVPIVTGDSEQNATGILFRAVDRKTGRPEPAPRKHKN
jgi:hypothetical protein